MRKEGCTEVQGFYIGMPRPVSEIGQMLELAKTPRAWIARRVI